MYHQTGNESLHEFILTNCKKGTIGDVFFIIRDGEVRITNDNPNGTEKEVARLGKSQYFGEAALIKVTKQRLMT